MSSSPDPQAEIEQIVTRIAQRAAANVADAVADLGRKLALAQETLDAQAAALAEKDKQLTERDAELARAHQVADELRQRIQQPDTAPEPPTDGVAP